MCFHSKMTDGQRQQFDQFGCVSRCIIEIARRQGHPITNEWFCKRFKHHFSNPKQCGMLLTSQISAVIPRLKLGRYFQVYRRYAAVKYHFEQHRNVLVLSEFDLFAGPPTLNDHCSVLTGIDDAQFRLWTPLIGEGRAEPPPLPADSWETLACTGVILLG
jgi:hypothetical protein